MKEGQTVLLSPRERGRREGKRVLRTLNDPNRDGSTHHTCGICILAGGLSKRMARDKSRVRLGARTLLGHIRQQSSRLGLPVRLIRHDLVRRCGPLGGICTALTTSSNEAELFLACDMPFLSRKLVESVVDCWRKKQHPVFMTSKSADGVNQENERNIRAGFPFVVPVRLLPIVRRQIAKNQHSIQALAKALKACLLFPPAGREDELFNINTGEDLKAARAFFRKRCSTVF